MSKRGPGANFGFGEERYGGEAQMDQQDKPQQATAAQLARRKIAQARKPGVNRGRSGSPAVNVPPSTGGGLFGNQQQSQPAANAFSTSNFSFAFGQPQQQSENGSASPAPFQFGVSAPAPSTQTNGNPFGTGAAPSFGQSFNSTASQTQQNGFNSQPSPAFPPTQPPQTSNIFSSFGQSQQTQQNGSTPTPATTTTSTFGSFGKPAESTQNGTNSFGGFGAKQPEDAPRQGTPSFGGFGAAQQEQGAPKLTFGGGFGAKQQEDSSGQSTPAFGGFGATQQEKEASKVSFGGAFDTSQAQNKSNPFAGFGQNKQEGEKAGTPDATPAPPKDSQQSNPFAGFSQHNTQAGDKAAPSPSFPAFGQANSGIEKSNDSATPKTPAFTFGQANGSQTAEKQTPKANGFNFGQSRAQSQSEQSQPSEKPAATNIFGSQLSQMGGSSSTLFGAKPISNEASTTGSSIFDNLPKKDLSNGGKPLFDSSDPSQIYRPEDDKDNEEDDSNARGGSNIFGKSGQKPSLGTSQSAGNPFSQSGSKDLFQPKASQDDTSMTTPGTTPQKNAFAAFAQTPTAAPETPAPVRSLFDRIEKPAEPSSSSSNNETMGTPTTAVKSLFQQPVSTTPGPSTGFNRSAAPVSETPAGPPPRSHFDRIEKPAPASTKVPTYNSPATDPPKTSPTAPEQSLKSSSTTELTLTQKAKVKQLNEGLIAHLQDENPEKDWTVIFDYYAKTAAEIRGLPVPPPQANAQAATVAASHRSQTPAPAASSNLFSSASKPTASTTNLFAQSNKPTNPSPLGQHTPQQAPSRPDQPPATAPTKKRPFEQDEASVAQAPATEKRSKPNGPINYPKLPDSASSTAKLFEAALDKTNATGASSASMSTGFKPSTTPLFQIQGSTPSSCTPQTKLTSGMPTFAPPAADGNFMAAFGKKATAEEEKQRKKRKDEDYDSEEETEEQWEKRDREEREAKRKSIAEAAKSPLGFSFTSSTSNANAPETPFKFGPSTSATTTSPAAPASSTSNLFGTQKATPLSTDAGKLAPPSTGFNFGVPKPASAEASRATTPGVTTDGETSTGDVIDVGVHHHSEPSDEQNDQQMDDPTALLSSERADNEILLEIPLASAKKLEKNPDESKTGTVWQVKSNGRVYVLKNKASGKTRILSKVGVGQPALNYDVVKGMKYELHPKKEKLVIAYFFDHIHCAKPKMDRFFIATQTVDEAKDLVKILAEAAK